MNCPVCNVSLTIAERHNIEIDFCPKCRGVWLDRGELDKIIERANETEIRGRRDSREYVEQDDFRPGVPPKRKKREGFLGDLFDF